MSSSPRSLARAAVIGLVMGLVAAAVIFLVGAIDNINKDCEFPDTDECNFELVEAQEVAKLQSYAAIGCALVAGGLFLTIRRR